LRHSKGATVEEPAWRATSLSASTKLRAADLVLSHGAKAIEIEDVEARVAELERAAEETRNKR